MPRFGDRSVGVRIQTVDPSGLGNVEADALGKLLSEGALDEVADRLVAKVRVVRVVLRRKQSTSLSDDSPGLGEQIVDLPGDSVPISLWGLDR
jgi:hypothetical protein